MQAALVALAVLVGNLRALAAKVVFAGKTSKISLVKVRLMVVAVFASMIFSPLLAAVRADNRSRVALGRKIAKVKTNMRRLPWIWLRSIAAMIIASS